MLCVIASRGKDADPELTLRAELVALEVTATWKHDSATYLRVEAPATAEPSTTTGTTGDPGARPDRARTSALEYTYRGPGSTRCASPSTTGAKGALVGEAIGRVTVPVRA